MAKPDLIKMIENTDGFSVTPYQKGFKVQNDETKQIASISDGRRAGSSPRADKNKLSGLKRIGWTEELYNQQQLEKRESRMAAERKDADRKTENTLAAITARVRGTKSSRADSVTRPEQEPSMPRSTVHTSKHSTDAGVDRIELLPFAGPIPDEVLRSVYELDGELAGKTFFLDLMDAQKAEVYLESNVEYNRHVLDNHVKVLEADMVDGTWRFNGASVLVSPDGELNDGQHRMHATVRAGENLKRKWWALVVSGIEREVFDTVDRGASRTLVNVLQTNGIPYARNLSGLVRRIIAWERGHKWFTQSKETMTYSQMFEKIMFCREMFDWAGAAMAAYAKEVKATNMNLNAWGVLLYMCATVSDRDVSEEFWGKRFAKALEVAENHPAYALRRRLLKNVKQVDTNVGTRKTTDMTYNDHIGFGLTAWNNYINERYSTQLRSPGVGWQEDSVNALPLASLL